MRADHVCIAALIAALTSLVPAYARAERRFAVQASVAEGVAVGDGRDTVILRRAPMFAELGLAPWSTDDDAWWLGGGVRMEFESQTSFGGSLRVGLAANLDVLSLRPYVGVALILAPLTLFGIEVGVDIVIAVADPFRIFARGFADGYVAGEDLPEGSILVAFNGAAGVEIVF